MAHCLMKNSHHTQPDYSQMSPKDTYVKPKVNRRSLGVYEQYLKRTTDNINQDINNSTHYLKRPITTDTDTAHKNLSTPKNVVVANESNSSAKILTIIGVFCSLLLLALVVILFNATDVLIDRLSAVDSQVSEVSDNISAIGKENSLAAAQVIAEEKAANAANARNLALVKESLNSMALNAELDKLKAEAKLTTRMRTMTLGESSIASEQATDNISAKPSISYDSFKEESQTVIYRETSR